MSEPTLQVGWAAALMVCSIESLESRSLLSAAGPASTHPAAADHLIAPALRVDASRHAPSKATLRKTLKKAVPTTSPNLVHDFEGYLKTPGFLGFGSQKLPIEIDITSQTLNSVTGTVTIEGHPVNGTLTGRLLTNRKFGYTISGRGIAFSMAGKCSRTGMAIAGQASLVLSTLSAFKITGNFLATAH